MFKKSKLINQEDKKKIPNFGELNETYYYQMIDYEKPYMDSLDYFTEKLEKLYNEIINAISKIQLEKYGEIYKQWKSSDGIDSFKFLIRLISILDNQYKENFDIDIKKEMPEKINELANKFELSYSLKEELIEVNSLRNKLVHDGYEINKEETQKIDKVIQTFTSEILFNVLKPLNLDKVQINDEFNLYDNNQINKEIGFFLSSYVSNLIRFNDMTKGLINPLVEKLGIIIEK
ncbi:MAG: hypothetical protein GF311_22995 [Candidatus Lokiarchaeota archaeon]|nr:hypothetical protein [Candidatus Lokiarchaeota archaeon]